MIARLVTLLPEPDSPTIAERLAAPQREREVRDRLDDAVAGPEVDGEVADVEAGVDAARPRSRHLGVPDARIEERVDDVDDEVHQRDRDGGAEHDAEHRRQVLRRSRR